MVMKFRSNPTGVMLAICEMIGQMEDLKLTVKTSDVAAWVGVTKSTAKTYLEKMVDKGLIIQDTVKWRGRANVHHWYLSTNTRNARLNFAVFKQSYVAFRDSRSGAWA